MQGAKKIMWKHSTVSLKPRTSLCYQVAFSFFFSSVHFYLHLSLTSPIPDKKSACLRTAQTRAIRCLVPVTLI